MSAWTLSNSVTMLRVNPSLCTTIMTLDMQNSSVPVQLGPNSGKGDTIKADTTFPGKEIRIDFFTKKKTEGDKRYVASKFSGCLETILLSILPLTLFKYILVTGICTYVIIYLYSAYSPLRILK